MSNRIVIDVGSGYMKAGLASALEPTCVFPTIVGKARRKYVENLPGNPHFTGEEAVAARQHLNLLSPVEHGHIEDWILMDEVWAHIFSRETGLDPEHHGLLVTVPPLSSQQHGKRLLETMFEIWHCPELTLQMGGILSLYSAAKTTGMCCEIGEGVTQIIPVQEGIIHTMALRRIDFGGQEVTMYLQKLLCNNGYPFTTRDDLEYVRLIKETYCYVAENPEEEDMRTDLDSTFTLPDGYRLRDGATSFTLGPDKFYAPEVIFSPSLMDRDQPPLYDLIMDAIRKAPIDFRTGLLQNIVLAGGTCMFNGLERRLVHDLTQIIPPSKTTAIK